MIIKLNLEFLIFIREILKFSTIINVKFNNKAD